MDGYIKEFAGSKNGFFNRNLFIKHDDNFNKMVSSIIKRFENKDVYYCIYSFEEKDLLLQGSFYIDIDNDIEDESGFKDALVQTRRVVNYFQAYFNIPREMQQIYFSGSKGFHILIPALIMNARPSKTLNDTYKVMASYIKRHVDCGLIDTRIYDSKRLFRIPNTINTKGNMYKVPVPLSLLDKCTLNDMRDWASMPRESNFSSPVPIKEAMVRYSGFESCFNVAVKVEKKTIKIPDKPRDLMPCVKKLLEDGAIKGQRNNCTVALSSSLIQNGYDIDSTIGILLEWNSNNEPPLDEQEINVTAKSAHAMVLSGKGYGCSAFKDIDLCVGAECKHYS